MPKYSIIIPVFNRPNEVDELLQSLTDQTFKDFEVIIIEDGSSVRCEEIINKYKNTLSVKYFYKNNEGQGFARNFGFDKASGDFFIQFDSDIIVPATYFEIVDKFILNNKIDAFGGPDASHIDFSITQKAINYAMTSFFTTGGIRGKKKNMGGKFHPRSFNFGISREVFIKTGGYKLTRMGEDIEFSIRIINAGFKVELIPEAFVYHKRRTSLVQFFKQLHFFGRARVNIWRFFPEELKAVHFFPFLFFLFIISIPLQIVFFSFFAKISLKLLFVYFLVIFFDAYMLNKNIRVAIQSVPASFIQLFAYGLGFFYEMFFNQKN